MEKEQAKSELERLQKEQRKARQDEVFGGLTKVELAEYDAKAKRISELEIELTAAAAKAQQDRQWNKRPETDILQRQARQPYRDRERNFGNREARNEPIELERRDLK